MQQFAITLKNEKLKFYNRISWIIIFIHLLFFLYLTLFSSDNKIRLFSICTATLLVVLLWFKYYLGSSWRFGFHPFFGVLMLGWLTLSQFWLATIPVVFAILYLLAIKKPTVIFSEEEIRYPSFLSQKITWDKLNNTLLKDGLLTIDFKNNKVIQQMADETVTVIDEREFNDFCRTQLRKSGPWKDEPGVWDALDSVSGLGDTI